MLEKDNLFDGKIYYLVWYYDADLCMPDIETYIYVGKNVLPSDKSSEEDQWYFQNPELYLEKGVFFKNQEGVDYGVLRADLDTLETMYNLEGLIATLSIVKNNPR